MSTELHAAESAAAELHEVTALVRKLLAEWEQFRTRATSAEARVRELESALRDVASGGVDPVALTQRVHALEQENRFLARRLDRARERVKKISAMLQFMHEDR